MGGQKKNHASLFSSLVENMQMVIDQLRDGESRVPDPDFSLDAFWVRIGAAVQAISREATKLCLAFSQPPYPAPADCQPLITGVENATLALVSAFYSLPKTQGVTLRNSVKDSTVSITQAVQTLASVIKAEGAHGSQQQRQSTGSVWEHCDNFTKLPKNNSQAVLRVAKLNVDLVKDALDEIEEAQSNDTDGCWDDLDEIMASEGHPHDNQDTWSAADKELLAPSTGLVKASRSCLKKVSGAVKKQGKCDCEAKVSQLDDIADKLRAVSPSVDDLASSLYAPMKQDSVAQNAETLCGILENLLQYTKHSHVTSEDDEAWLEFLLKAIRHNMDKITDLIHKET